MRPEKRNSTRWNQRKFIELGIPRQWVPIVQKSGYLTVEQLKKVNPNKLHQELCGINKKYKLGLQNPTIDEVKNWVEN